MHRSKIEWVLNPDNKTLGWIWNPITGCLNSCPYCYARKLANTRLRERYLANRNMAPLQDGWLHEGDGWKVDSRYDAPFYPRFWPERCTRKGMVQTRKPERKGIFVCDMSDLFGFGIPEEWTRKVLTICHSMCWHRFYLLTKQPQNLAKFSPFPDNCWVGFTATTDKALQRGLAHIAEVKAKIKYISFEPLLGRVSFLAAEMVDWVIIGAMTCGGGEIAELSSKYPELTPMPCGKRYTLQPKIGWVQEIVTACDKAGIPVFLKDNLKPLLRQNEHNVYSYPEWASKQFAVTGDHSLAPTNPHPNEPMRKLRQELPR